MPILAQPLAGQTAEDLLRLEPSAKGELEAVGASVRGDPTRWRGAFSRARHVGPILVAPLLANARREGDAMRRGLWIAAAAAAAGGRAPSALLDDAWMPGAKRQDVLLALLGCAAFPGTGAGEALHRLFRDGPSEAIRLFAGVAMWRCATPIAGDAAWLSGARRDDAGMVAAAILSGAPVPEEVLERWLQSREPSASLVARAVLLTPFGSGLGGIQRSLARRALGSSGESELPLRLAAAACCARMQDGEALLPDHPPAEEAVAVLCGEPAGRAMALRRGWLSAVPSARLEIEPRRVLASAFALAAPAGEVEAAAASFARAPELAETICLAVAYRAATRPEGLVPGPWLERLPAVACGFARVALGVPDTGIAGAGSALRLAQQGRIPASDLAAVVERELWQARGHPGRAVHAVEMALLRDLLVAGSDWAKARDARRRAFPYLAAELAASDDILFGPACELLDWVVDEGDLPPGLRLRQ